ncbi:MAG: ABC transporter ATP-binding protein [Desulfomonilaceae bacterium]
MIEIMDLYSGYSGSEILKGISLKVNLGEMVGILGPNGSGKTTLINTMSGVLKPKSGKILINGTVIDELEIHELSKQIAVAPQKTEISFPFKCFSITLMGRSPHVGKWGFYSENDKRIALEAMNSTNTLKLSERPITNVSGGEAQMVTVARVLAQQTGILLLDEVTSNLDVSHKMAVFDLLTRMNLQGATIISVMHDLNLAALYCNRLVFLKNGKILLDGPTHEVFQQNNLREIYETEVQISFHPVTKSPQAHFVPGFFRLSRFDNPNCEPKVSGSSFDNRRHKPNDKITKTSPKNNSVVRGIQ